MRKVIVFFSIFLILFMSCFIGFTYAAEDTYPPLPNFAEVHNMPEDQLFYIVIKTFDGKYMYYCFFENSGAKVRGYKYDDTLLTFEQVGNNTRPTWGRSYAVVKNGVWTHPSTGDTGYALTTSNNNETLNISMTESFELLYSNKPIYMSKTSDEIFFPEPPTPSNPTVEEMVAEEVPIMAEKVVQTMKIILLCGVGCLAFLVCLVILPKVLYRFL